MKIIIVIFSGVEKILGGVVGVGSSVKLLSDSNHNMYGYLSIFLGEWGRVYIYLFIYLFIHLFIYLSDLSFATLLLKKNATKRANFLEH